MPKLKVPSRSVVTQQPYTSPDVAGLDMMGPLSIPAVAIAKLPFPVLRQNADAVLKKLMGEKWATPDIQEAFAALKQRYPRVFGHVYDVVEETDPMAMGRTYPTRGMGNAGLSKVGIQPGLSRLSTHGTAAHELTHAAQNTWNPQKFRTAVNAEYGNLDTLKGRLRYQRDPFERGANKAGLNAARRAATVKKGK